MHCAPQVEGVAWLLAQHQRGLNSILADEMGLGKTLQSIAFLATLKWGLGVPGPHLVVVPLSVMSSWMAELARCVQCGVEYVDVC
jgi:SWI/SNF-related matrix-associated actin-dependent regulator of chromatin subfamily A member 5